MEDLYSLSRVVREIVGENLRESHLEEFIPAEGPLNMSLDRFISLITDVKSMRDTNVNVYKRFVEDGELFTISFTNSIDVIEEFMECFDVSDEIVHKFKLYRQNPFDINSMETKYFPTIDIACPWGEFTIKDNPHDYAYNVCYNCVKYDDHYGIKNLLTFYPRTVELLVRLRKLEYLKTHISEFTYKSEKYVNIAAENGDLECMKWLISKGSTVGKNVFCYAAKYGRLDCIKWLHENGYPWSKYTLSHAAFGGHLECLKYAHASGGGSQEFAVCQNAAMNGYLECLIYAFTNGFICDVSVSANAGKNGHFECLKYLHNNRADIHPDISYYAAISGNMECLRWTYENGYRMSQSICNYAERVGNIDCLRYAYEHGGIWHNPNLNHSFETGNLECIKYVYEKGICNSKININDAAKHLHVLKWLHESDLIDFSHEINIQNIKLECMEYILQHGLIRTTKGIYGPEMFKLYAKYKASSKK